MYSYESFLIKGSEDIKETVRLSSSWIQLIVDFNKKPLDSGSQGYHSIKILFSHHKKSSDHITEWQFCNMSTCFKQGLVGNWNSNLHLLTNLSE